MEDMLARYLRHLRDYHVLVHILFFTVEKRLTFHPTHLPANTLDPNQSSIAAQIQHLRSRNCLLPPAAWVQPNRGTIEHNEITWQYSFHGIGMSFLCTNSPENAKDISLEFSANGEIAFTQYTIGLYIETCCKTDPAWKEILQRQIDLLDQGIHLQHLLLVPPYFLGNDPTYILLPNP